MNPEAVARQLLYIEEKYALNAAIRRRSGGMLMGSPGPEFKGSIISVLRVALILKLKENLEKHKAEYTEAVQDFKKALIKHFEEQVVLAKEGKETERIVPFDTPESHEAEYNRTILMLDMCTKEEIYISEQEFQHYVMDDWTWKRDFAMSNAQYKIAAARR
jgi:hypothetical protein